MRPVSEQVGRLNFFEVIVLLPSDGNDHP